MLVTSDVLLNAVAEPPTVKWSCVSIWREDLEGIGERRSRGLLALRRKAAARLSVGNQIEVDLAFEVVALVVRGDAFSGADAGVEAESDLAAAP